MTVKKKANEKNGSIIDTILIKMLDNLYLTIKNVHLRFEVSQIRSEQAIDPFSFGIGIKSLELFAVDEKQ